MVKQQREMRTKCEYLSVEQVDEAIARLENRMAHTSMSLNEEKKAMEDIKRLKVFTLTRLERKNTACGLCSSCLLHLAVCHRVPFALLYRPRVPLYRSTIREWRD